MHTKLSQKVILDSLLMAGFKADKSTVSRDLKKLREEEEELQQTLSIAAKQETFRGTVRDLYKKSITLFTNTNKGHEKLKALEFCLKCELVLAETEGIRGPLDVEPLSNKDHMIYVEELIRTSQSESLRSLGALFQGSVKRWNTERDGGGQTGQMDRDENGEGGEMAGD